MRGSEGAFLRRNITEDQTQRIKYWWVLRVCNDLELICIGGGNPDCSHPADPWWCRLSVRSVIVHNGSIPSGNIVWLVLAIENIDWLIIQRQYGMIELMWTPNALNGYEVLELTRRIGTLYRLRLIECRNETEKSSDRSDWYRSRSQTVSIRRCQLPHRSSGYESSAELMPISNISPTESIRSCRHEGCTYTWTHFIQLVGHHVRYFMPHLAIALWR